MDFDGGQQASAEGEIDLACERSNNSGGGGSTFADHVPSAVVTVMPSAPAVAITARTPAPIKSSGGRPSRRCSSRFGSSTTPGMSAARRNASPSTSQITGTPAARAHSAMRVGRSASTTTVRRTRGSAISKSAGSPMDSANAASAKPIATVGTPSCISTRETLTPLPPGRSSTSETRCTAPSSTWSTRYVTSYAGLSVTVRIIRSTRRVAAPSAGAAPRRRSLHRRRGLAAAHRIRGPSPMLQRV